MTDGHAGRSPSPDRFDTAYAAGHPPWDVGRPQPALVAAAERGEIVGRVLDIGCGTGENALYLAQRDHEVVGVDLSRHALEHANQKAATRGLNVTFHLMDALAVEPGGLAGRFDTVVDSGLFHVFNDDERVRYVRALERILRPDGVYHMFVFSDKEPPDWGGPRRVSEDEIHSAFRHGWTVLEVRPVRFATNLDINGHAWHARIRKA